MVETPVPSALRCKRAESALRQLLSLGGQLTVPPRRSPPPTAMPEPEGVLHELDDEVGRGQLGRCLEPVPGSPGLATLILDRKWSESCCIWGGCPAAVGCRALLQPLVAPGKTAALASTVVTWGFRSRRGQPRRGMNSRMLWAVAAVKVTG
ncbi:hypothetical protein SRO_6373 [Streptomyces rochei]|nr:hypothetical protein SRO_6373 [Streptomyces rochei]